MGPSTPQRPIFPHSDGAAEETPRTPSGLGLLSTPPRRPPRSLKRPREADVDTSETRDSGPLRLFQTPPLRPPRRARFSTGFTGLANSSPEFVAPSDTYSEGAREEMRSPSSLADEPRPTMLVCKTLGGQVDGQQESPSDKQMAGFTKEPIVEQAEERDDEHFENLVMELATRQGEEQTEERITERIDEEAEDEADDAGVLIESPSREVVRHQESEDNDDGEQGTTYHSDNSKPPEKSRNAKSERRALDPVHIPPEIEQEWPHLTTQYDEPGDEPFQLSD